jgi:hypothetical protein
MDELGRFSRRGTMRFAAKSSAHRHECRLTPYLNSIVPASQSAKRAEFFPADPAEVPKNVDGLGIDHLVQFKERLIRLQIGIIFCTSPAALFRGLRAPVDLNRRGQASDQANAIGDLLDPDVHRHALSQTHPGEDRIHRGKPLLVWLRV